MGRMTPECERREMIRQVCMYCNRFLGEIDSHGQETIKISHGICTDCLPIFRAEDGQPFGDFLDSLPGPVFVVDSDGHILGANAAGRKTVPEDFEKMRGRFCGEVFSCSNAEMPGGCGQTVHCKTCTIRRCVTETFETGMPHFQVPAYMDLGDRVNIKTVRYLITTEKVEDYVLLLIEDAPPIEPDQE